MELDDLVAYKDFLYGEYDIAKKTRADVSSIAFHIATLEDSIAEELIKANKPTEAVIHLVSQGSLLAEIGYSKDARAAWEKAKSLTDNEKVKSWVDEALCRLK